MNLFLFFMLVILVVVLYFSKEKRNKELFMSPGVMDQMASTEAFGMSPGVMDQLASTRVVSKREQEVEDQLYNNLTAQGIINMTETGYKGTDYASTALE
jgi:hypothetical protein